METLDNGIISIAVKEHGAELASIKYKGREYLWQADGEFWARHSPVLFPIVGNVWNKEFRSHGKVYPMGQHGFARDMDFALAGKSGNEIWYRLVSSGATLEKYPYPFVLEIGYRIGKGGEDSREARSVEVMWRVYNSGEENMSFQIGAHPAFHWPLLSDNAIAAGTAAMKQELAGSTARGYFRLALGAHLDGCGSGCGWPDDREECSCGEGCGWLDGSKDCGCGENCGCEKGCEEFGESGYIDSKAVFKSGKDSTEFGGDKGSAGFGESKGSTECGCGKGFAGHRIAKSVIGAGGCFDEALGAFDILDEDCMLHIDPSSFDRDALVYENSQVNAVTLCGEDRKPYLTLAFDTPVVGLWSSPGKNAPFVCIEPWYGRADSVGFTGDYEEKPWINCIAPGDTFTASYTITIE